MDFNFDDVSRGIELGRRRLPQDYDEIPQRVFDNLGNKIGQAFEQYPAELTNRFVVVFSELATIAEASRYNYREEGEEPLQFDEVYEYLEITIRFLNSFSHGDVPPPPR